MYAHTHTHKDTDAAMNTYAYTATNTHTHTECRRFLGDSRKDEILLQRPHTRTHTVHNEALTKITAHTHTHFEVLLMKSCQRRGMCVDRAASATTSRCQRLHNLTRNMHTDARGASAKC